MWTCNRVPIVNTARGVGALNITATHSDGAGHRLVNGLVLSESGEKSGNGGHIDDAPASLFAHCGESGKGVPLGSDSSDMCARTGEGLKGFRGNPVVGKNGINGIQRGIRKER